MFNFKSVKQLITHFADEKTCWDYLEKQLWDGTPVCPHCGCTNVYRLENHKQFKCGNKKTCDQKFTVLVGTVYENTKLPLSTWFAAIFLATSHKKGISSCQLARDLGIKQPTAWHLLHRIREMIKCASDVVLDKTIQIDETYVKGDAKNRHKRKRKLIAAGFIEDEPMTVLGMVENKGRLVLKSVPDAEGDTLKPVINANITNKEAIIVTDGHMSYRAIAEEYGGHIIINHSKDEYVNGGYHTNGIEGAFSHFNRTIYGTYHFVSKKHIQRYCNLFSYRFSTRTMTEPQRFDDVTKKGKTTLTYDALTKK